MYTWRLVVSMQRYFPLTVNCTLFTSLCNKRVQNFLKLLYWRLFFTQIPAYLKLAFTPVVFLWFSRQLHSVTLIVNVDKLDRFHTLVSWAVECATWLFPECFAEFKRKIQGLRYLDVDSFCLQNAGTGAEWFSNDIELYF